MNAIKRSCWGSWPALLIGASIFFASDRAIPSLFVYLGAALLLGANLTASWIGDPAFVQRTALLLGWGILLIFVGVDLLTRLIVTLFGLR